MRGRENLGTYGESKIGLVRKVNEDSFYISHERNVLAVADGMGGYVGGEIASKTAVEAIAYYFKNFNYAHRCSWKRQFSMPIPVSSARP